MQTKEIYIFGYSGHAYVVLDTLDRLQLLVKGYFDFDKSEINPYEIDYLGFENSVNAVEIINEDFVFPAVGENRIRKKIVEYFEKYNLHQITIIDPSSDVSPKARIQSSSYIGKNVSINSFAKIGKGVIVNTAAVIEHECNIGNYCHIAPNATLAGNVSLGEGVFLGAGAIVKQGISIGDNAVIGAGAVVISNIPANEVWAGCPAKKIK